MRLALPSLLALPLLLSAGCAPPTSQVERALERELPRAIGPADRYEVQIEGLRAATGEAARVSVRGEGVRREDAPLLERLDIQLHGVRYDRRNERLERVDSTAATARVRARDLAAYLEAHRNVREAAVTLRAPDEATIRLRPELGGLPVPRGATVEASGRLRAADGHAHFEVEAVRAGGLSLGGAAAQRLSDLINPLVDLSGAPGDLRVTGVRAEEGAVVLEATGDLSGLSLRDGAPR